MVKLDEIPSSGDRYSLDEPIGCGVYGKVYSATDSQASNKKVAIKVQKLGGDTTSYIEQEYGILRDLSSHANLPDFYGIYRNNEEIWFVLELCEGGPVTELIKDLLAKNRRMVEEHIAYILKEVVKALVYLHHHHVMHRDIRANNILLTREGEVKLTDFGLSHNLQSTLDKTGSFLGSPGWMAPEVILSAKNHDLYGSRSDVWSLGITAIEIGDGKAPYESMHPTRALFQIVTDPPPTLRGISNWSENYTDFVNECLEKNPEHRPFMVEVAEHPFLEQIPDNNYHLSLELKSLLLDMDKSDKCFKPPEVIVNGEYLRRGIDGSMEKMHVEDLASLNSISEQKVMEELEERWKIGEYQSFVGDVLLVLNPTADSDIYGDEFHRKYQQKSRSDNAPHIYAVADSAYQDALHHMVTQRIVLAGESGSGKTKNYLHLIDHLLHLGDNRNISLTRLKNGIKLIHALTHASTPINFYSTRCLLKTEIKFGSTGKVSGAAFNVFGIEKWRVSSVDMFQGNFHFFYYVYDGLSATNKLEQYHLDSGRQYRYLRITEQDQSEIASNASKFKTLLKIFEEFEFSPEDIDTVLSITAAILTIGEIRFQPDGDGAFIENEEIVSKIAQLLKIEQKKLAWALINYCLIHDGQAIKRKSTVDEARDARDVFANTLYTRLVDYIVAVINHKFAIGSAIFGEKYSVEIFDYFGFECFKKNHLPQLLVNSLNEQLQYHYLQRNFSWECLDVKAEGVGYTPFQYYDNKITLDSLLGKSEGLLNIIDQASKTGRSGRYVMEFVHNQESECIAGGSRASEFTVAHYTGKVTYDVKEMPDKNRDFLPPEIIETMRLSDDRICHLLFSNKLNKSGNLLVNFESSAPKKRCKSDTCSESAANQYSQIRKMRTYMATFKALSLELLKELSIGSGSGGTHFVRCIRPTLKKKHEFHGQLVKQQLRALAVVATAKGRQRGFPHRIPFAEFLRRYQFLAFDFNENVDINKDNCRLLLVRLKLEGWAIGKTKVFLKYYHEEYLSRLYETQVRKIVKIQSILRGFLAKCRVAQHVKVMQEQILRKASLVTGEMSEEEAALIIQKAYRGVNLKRTYDNLAKDYDVLNEEQCNFVRNYARRWRCNSMFHVLLQYRAMRLQDIFNLAQQVHLYNLSAFHNVRQIDENVYNIDTKAQVAVWLGDSKIPVLKMPFRLDEIPFYDTTNMRDLLTNTGASSDRDDSWDTPYRWRKLTSTNDPEEIHNYGSFDEELTRLPYNRDPEEPLHHLADAEINTFSKKVKDEENEYVRNKDKDKEATITTTPNNRQTKKVESKIFENNLKNKTEDVSKREVNSNSKPANKDFDFIRPPVTMKPKYTSADPVAELKQIGGKTTGNEDDPPFNFQGMLRKTNYGNREPVKPVENVRTFSLKKKLVNINMNGVNDNNVSFEVAPGIIIEGIEVEL